MQGNEPAAREIGMKRVFGYLHNETERLDDLLIKLEDRLKDVLIPRDPVNPGVPNSQCLRKDSPLAAGLEEQASKIRRSADTLQGLLSRLDI